MEKKNDYFAAKNIQYIDYKDVETLKRFLNPHGRIMARRRTGISAKHQRELSTAIKRARFMGLLAYIEQ